MKLLLKTFLKSLGYEYYFGLNINYDFNNNYLFSYLFIKVVPDRWLDELMEVCKTHDYAKAEEFVEKFMMEAYSTTQVFCQIEIYVY